MFAKIPRHAGAYRPARDVALALAGPAAGRHRAGPAEPLGVSLADMIEPVVPPAGFPGFPHVPALKLPPLPPLPPERAR